ncbi:hypothetical protein MA47_11015 [Corynebacterium auriscanis]|uniref:Uncharacterized protein n=1 Tax=Corynebacterium auriscanis TaxID=99807 RepID=A0A0A2DFS8_9CORY|nr:hypothetical protein [Corynebacterium auriscanis]KGM18013.1 hypothetical protein MA47_11015 [Corynebacterium auriscanis]
MAHYNIYDDLGIDRNLESSRIVNLIDERLSSTPRDNVADFDRLTTSRHLFEDDSRRSAYDKALDDPDHPDITIGSFRAFADGTYSTQSTKPRHRRRRGQHHSFRLLALLSLPPPASLTLLPFRIRRPRRPHPTKHQQDL